MSHQGISPTVPQNQVDQDTFEAICQGTQESRYWQRKVQEACRDVLFVHLQGVEAGPSGYWNLQKGHVHYEFLHQWYFRAYRNRSWQAFHLQQEGNFEQSRQTAVRLMLPGGLAKHAVSEGTKAVTKFSSSKDFSYLLTSLLTTKSNRIF
jgi:hypothetical protein